MNPVDALALILAWGLYGAVHSMLAADRVKDAILGRWPRLLRYYRLAYNFFAVLLLLPPVWLTARIPGEALWHWPGWIAWPVLILALLGFALTLRGYDGLEFIGLAAWRGEFAAGERLALSPLHRHVRHPWYALGLAVLWTRDLNAAWLLTALVITLYVRIGIHFEERRLTRLHGERYRAYQRRVPALIPWPGRSLGVEEAAAWTSRSGG